MIPAQSDVDAPARPALGTVSFHHVGVQTADLANSVAWYRDFFNCEISWSLSRFSELTLSRLPGIGTLVELVCERLRFHLFDRQGTGAPVDPISSQYQHICLRVESREALAGWRAHWIALYRSGRYTFACDEQPTEVVVDSDGVASCYLRDVNGLEYELAYLPDGRR
jgi:catechol 2,3-dioxygenase-like lactoylglutathione lyase family enzyme